MKRGPQTPQYLFQLVLFALFSINHVICSNPELTKLLQSGNNTENTVTVFPPTFQCGRGIEETLTAFSNLLPSNDPYDVDLCNPISATNYSSYTHGLIKPTKYCNQVSNDSALCGSGNIDAIEKELLPTLEKFLNEAFHESCHSIWLKDKSAPSGDYYLIRPNGERDKVYCDMQGSDCDGEGGWTKVAYINTKESASTCPSGLAPIQYSNIAYQLCNKVDPHTAGCDSTYFDTHGIDYTKVCGRAKGYQFRSPDGFHPTAGISVNNIDGVYLDGISITHGINPRKHIWSLAGGLTEGVETYWHCPCNINSYHSVPSFVGNDYYCESAVNAGHGWATVLYPDDPLWDGNNCEGVEAGCCTAPNMPWFMRTLPGGSTSDDIELRVCSSQSAPDTEGTPLELVELFIK